MDCCALRFAVIVLSLLVPFVSGAVAPTLTHGVASGEVTDTSAVIWARASAAGRFSVEYAESSEFHAARVGGIVQATRESDFAGTVALTDLQPVTRYHYRVRLADRPLADSLIGSFTTAPKPSQPRDVTFLWGGDLGGQGRCRQPTYAIFGAMTAQKPEFFVFSGDTIYADSPCPSPPNVPGADFVAATQEQFWAKYRYQREDPSLREFLAVTPVYAVWDDHEVRGDFAGPSAPLAPLGFRAFFDYFPIRRIAAEPLRLYRSFRWGKHVEVFLLDTRQYRSPNWHADGPEKTMLGPAQLRWFLARLTASSATWKIVVSSVPLSARTGSVFTGRDGWGGDLFAGGFRMELSTIIAHIQEHRLRNVVWLGADIHVARILSYDPDDDGTPDFYECISGPLSARSGDFDALDPTFHPEVLYQKTGFLNFGVVKINGKSGTLTVEIRDQDGKVHYTLALPPHS